MIPSAADIILIQGRLVLGAVFLLSGAAKLANLTAFRSAMESYDVPRWLRPPATYLLPAGEIVVAVLLLLGISLLYTAATAGLILVVFSFAALRQLLRHHQMSCHCFGNLLPERLSWVTIARNGALIILSVWVAISAPDPYSVEHRLDWTHTQLPPEFDLVAAGLMVAATILVYLQLARLLGWDDMTAVADEPRPRSPGRDGDQRNIDHWDGRPR